MANNTYEKMMMEFALKLDSRDALDSVKEMGKEIQKLTKKKYNFKNLGADSLKSFRKDIRDSQRGTKMLRAELDKTAKGWGKWAAKRQKMSLEKDFKKAEKASKHFYNETLKWQKEITAAEKKASKSRSDEDRVALKRIQDKARAEMKVARMAMKSSESKLRRNMQSTGATHTIGKNVKATKELSEFKKNFLSDSDWKKGATEFADDFAGALSSLSSRDLAGFAKNLFKGSGNAMKGTAASLGKWANNMKDAGGGGPAVAMAKGMSKAMDSLAPMMKALSEAGPLLGAAAGILVGIVKLMIDIDSKGKEINKELLEGASTADLFARAGNDASRALDMTKHVLDDIRDQTSDISMNMDWGTKAEDHRKFINVLKQEGMTLAGLAQGFHNAQLSSDEGVKSIQNWTDMTKVGVAYSRIFGKSLDEIAQFQGEMMTTMGTSLSEVQLQFARMTRDANESGIAANKFFDIIRGVSSDLGLYGNRLEEVTTILGKMGRVMNPRNAAKFMQTATQGLKSMGEEERIRLVLLAGEVDTRKIANKEMERNQTAFVNKLQKDSAVSGAHASEALKKALAGDKTELEGILGTMAPTVQAQFREAFADMKQDANRLNKGGLIGLEEVASKFGPAAAAEMNAKAMKKFGGGGKLRDMTGVQAFAVRKLTGKSMEDFDAAAKMESAVDDQKDALIRALKDPNNPNSRIMIEKMENLGIIAKGERNLEKDSKKIAAAGYNEIFDTMAQDDQEALTQAQEQKDYAQETSKFTSSINDKMDAIIDGIFNFLYKIFSDMFDTVNELFGKLGSWLGKDNNVDTKAQKRALMKKARGVEGPMGREVLRALQGEGDAKTALATTLGPKMMATWQSMDKQIGDLDKKANDPNLSAEKRSDAASKAHMLRGSKSADMMRMMGAVSPEGLKQAMGAAGVGGKDVKSLTPQELTEVMGKIFWFADPEKLVDSLPKMAQPSGAPAPAPIAAAIAGGGGGGSFNPVTAQQVSTAGAHAAPGNMLQGLSAGGGGSSDAAPMTAGQGDDLLKGNEGLQRVLAQQGIKLDKSFVQGPYAKMIEDSVLNATRQALFEYYLYKEMSPSTLKKQAMDNKLGSPGQVGQMLAQQFAQGNADGGRMIGMNPDGSAKMLKPPPGEAFTPIGKNETIVPQGGSGGGASVSINVQTFANGNGLGAYLQQEVPKIIYDYERRKKNK